MHELLVGAWVFAMFLIWAAGSGLIFLIRERREYEEWKSEMNEMWLESLTYECREIHLPGDCLLCSGITEE